MMRGQDSGVGKQGIDSYSVAMLQPRDNRLRFS
jgi:hypothetical protein